MNNLRKILTKNIEGRDFILGDLHGCYDQLQTLMKYVKFDKSVDRMISVGDIIDRGSKSMDCLSLIYEPWFHMVRGNHEQMMIDYYYGTQYYANNIWDANGGSWRIEHDIPLMKVLALDLCNLPYVITIDGVCNVVHAQLPVNRDGLINQSDLDKWEYQDYELDMMIWNRQLAESWYSYEFDVLPTFAGHTVFEYVKEKSSHIFIDTGAVYGQSLTMVELIPDIAANEIKIHKISMESNTCTSEYRKF